VVQKSRIGKNISVTPESEYNRFLVGFSKNLRAIIDKLGLTQEELSLKCGMNYRFYQKLESGKYSPSLSTIFKLAQALKIKVTDLLD